MFNISKATSADIPFIIAIAKEAWWATYEPILTADQIRYMLGALYSPEALESEMSRETQTFLLLHDDGMARAFASYGQRPEESSVCKLHKLYVLPKNQKKGYGTAVIAEIKRRLSMDEIHTLDLNVNRNNPARHFYQKLGFRILREEDIPIGPYWMNDYVMRLSF